MQAGAKRISGKTKGEKEIQLSAYIPADIDGDGVVGINDFLALLANWGPCP